MIITITINGIKKKLFAPNGEFLADTLRKAGYLSVRKGCDTISCGLCTVLLEGKPILSCSTLSVKANNKSIETIEGREVEARKFAQFLAEEGGDQCGYCVPGFVLTVLAMKNELKNPTENEIIHYMNGNMCRCTGYMSHLRAIKKFMEVI